ncbi:hypothetical protein ACVNPZ_10860 [Staphylococcus aureus]
MGYKVVVLDPAERCSRCVAHEFIQASVSTIEKALSTNQLGQKCDVITHLKTFQPNN